MLFGVYGKSLWGEVMTQEALKLALEALEANDKLINGSGTSGGLLYCMDAYYSDCFDADPIVKQIDEAVAAIKEALAQPERTALQIKKTDPFESARIGDYNRGWNDCLFASGIVKQPQRTELKQKNGFAEEKNT